jgi:NADH-quinone oxidoreductase subunit E
MTTDRAGPLPAEIPPLPEGVVAELRALTGRYPLKRGALLLMLHRVQEQRGWIAPADMRLCGELCGISAAEVFSVVSFYTMLRTRPGARFEIGVCRNIACWVNGAEALTAAIARKLGVAPGEVTPDGNFRLQEVECLGACGGGPCLEIDSLYFERMDGAKAGALIDRLAAERGPPGPAIEAAARAARSGA